MKILEWIRNLFRPKPVKPDVAPSESDTAPTGD
jgi:hypothetical protein